MMTKVDTVHDQDDYLGVYIVNSINEGLGWDFRKACHH